jgi:hypothetical protein
MKSSRYASQILIELGFSKNISEKSSNIKFHENPSSGSRVAPCGQGDQLMDRRTDITKLIAIFPNSESEPKNEGFYFQNTFSIYLIHFYFITQKAVNAVPLLRYTVILNLSISAINSTIFRLLLFSHASVQAV